MAGAAGSARAVAVVNADGSFLQGVGFPKNVTGVSHTGGSGIYCIILSGGFDPSDAMASLSQGFISDGYSVSASADSPGCASGEAEVDTVALEQSGTTTAGTPIEALPADAGFTVLVPYVALRHSRLLSTVSPRRTIHGRAMRGQPYSLWG